MAVDGVTAVVRRRPRRERRSIRLHAMDHSASAHIEYPVVAWAAREWDAVSGRVVSYQTDGFVVSLSP